MNAIAAIEGEIRHGQEILEKLEVDVAAKKQAAQLSDEEAEGVAYLVQEAVRRERRPTFTLNVLLTLSGILIGTFVERWVPWGG